MNLLSSERKAKLVLILSGDHIYKLDYLKLLQYHTDKKAHLSMACIEVPKDEATRFGIVSVNAEYKVDSFIEKPKNPPGIPDNPNFSFVNMGIYVFDANALREIFTRNGREAYTFK